MSLSISALANSQNFGSFQVKLNQIVGFFNSNTVTADSSNTGSVTTGNAVVNGFVTVNTLYAGNVGGGTPAAAANLAFQTNATFNYQITALGAIVANAAVTLNNTLAVNGNITSNSNIQAAANLNSNNLTVTSNTVVGSLNVTGNTTLIGNCTVTGNFLVVGATQSSGNQICNGAFTPASNVSFVLGNTTEWWATTYTANLNCNNVISTNTVTAAAVGMTYSNETSGRYSFVSGVAQDIDTFAFATYRSAKYLLQFTSGNNYHFTEISVTHNGTTTYMTEYGTVISNTNLATISTNIGGSLVHINVTPAFSNVVATFVRTAMVV